MRSSNCLVAKNNISGAEWFGILLFDDDDSIVRENYSAENWGGISLLESENGKVTGNVCSTNRVGGIELGSNCRNNMVKNNLCNQNGSWGFVLNWHSTQNKIGPNNTANSNGYAGIFFYSEATGNIVQKNDFHCNVAGDIIDQVGGNTFIKNSAGPLPECQYCLLQRKPC
jgi:parallel beta-helix repeat protein